MNKLEAIDKLKDLSVPARPFFYPLSSLPAYRSLEETYRPRNPNAYDICARGINLPGALTITEDQIDLVCDGLRQLLAS
jgi:perosamine synthetase